MEGVVVSVHKADSNITTSVVTNAQGSVTSNAAALTVISAGTPYVTSKTLGTLRNNFTGWVGMQLTVGSSGLVITSLGRIVAPGTAAPV